MVMELQPIEEFFAGRVVFLTGASGFLGKMTLEKILRSCPRVKKIYILLRGKKGKDAAQRLDDVLSGVVFERLNKERPEYRQQIEMIVGDCCLPDLALRPEARAKIVREVDVILHWAATVRFDENLKVATNINVCAVRDLLRMAREMPQLKVFEYVSTAFSNCVRSDIDEIFYGTPVSGAGLISAMDAFDAKLIADITPQIIGKWPNTYVFTKAIAENLIKEEGRGLPIGIIRPSIVLGSYKEPVPGWIDNVYGATGILEGIGMGLIRTMETDINKIAEMIPADFVVNTALAAVVEIDHKFMALSEEDRKTIPIEEAIPIYNVVTSTLKELDWLGFTNLAKKHLRSVPSAKVIWHPFCWYTSSHFLYLMLAFLLHTAPAYVVDFIARIMGKKPLMVKGYQKIHKFMNVIIYFSKREWKFHNDNVQKLWTNMQREDRKTFDFNVAAFDWDDFFYYYVRGGRLYLVQDTIDTIPQGERWLRILFVGHWTLCAVLSYLLYKSVCLFLSFLDF